MLPLKRRLLYRSCAGAGTLTIGFVLFLLAGDYIYISVSTQADLWEYVRQDPLRLKAVQYVVHELSNILEDGYVENRILLEFPGSLAYGLEAVRAKHFQKMLTVTQMKEREENGKISHYGCECQI